KMREESPVTSRCYAYREDTEHFFVKDQEHPYIKEKPFDWIRGYQVGGKSLIWARQTQRWSKYDFEGPGRDGVAVDWPRGYEDVAPWSSHVESVVEVSGTKDRLDTLAGGEFLPGWKMNDVEREISRRSMNSYTGRSVIIGRCAHLPQPKEGHLEQGRG